MVTDMKHPTIQGSCQFEYWDKDARKMTHCGQNGVVIRMPSNSPKKKACLCKEHIAYVVDCYDRSEVDIYKARKKEIDKKVKQYKLKLESF